MKAKPRRGGTVFSLRFSAKKRWKSGHSWPRKMISLRAGFSPWFFPMALRFAARRPSAEWNMFFSILTRHLLGRSCALAVPGYYQPSRAAGLESCSIQLGSADAPSGGWTQFATDPNYRTTDAILTAYKNLVTC
jgi:hypothetical protein